MSAETAAKVLVTGFRAFGPHAENASETVVRRLAADPPAGLGLETLVLPVEYARAVGPVRDRLDAGGIRAVLHLGLAADRPTLEFERFALNWRGAESADVAGVRLDGAPIDPAGPAAYLATAPVDDLVGVCRAAGVPVRTSQHAGTFLCNQVLYQTLRLADLRGLRLRAAFLHVPVPGPDRSGISDLVRAVTAAARRLAELPPPPAPGRRSRTGETSRTFARPTRRGPRRTGSPESSRGPRGGRS
jgi:pyroglutamyl-peptidase